MDMENPNTPKERPKNANLSGLKRCFQTLVDRKQLNLDTVVLELMLKHEILIDLDKLDKALALALPSMLVYYMKNWPGWQKSPEYYSGKLSFKDWFLKFKQYISVKLKYLIKNGYSDVLSQLHQVELKTSTDAFVPPSEEAPFVINIQGVPKILSTLVFDLKNNDITINRHIEPTWVDISLAALVNWPYVGIEFRSSEFAFKRYNKNEYRRWLNLTSCSVTLGPVKFIEEARIINRETGRAVHSLERLYAYSKQLVELLYSIKKDVNERKIDIIEILLEEFLKDIKEIGINDTFATNTNLVFNIGGQQVYMRNKKTDSKEPDPRRQIGLCELLIPKMEIQLNYFSALEDATTPYTSFSYLNSLHKMIKEKSIWDNSNLIPSLIFKCLFCNVDFDSHGPLLSHFKTLHGMEAPYSCNHCNKMYTVPYLAEARWRHECTK